MLTVLGAAVILYAQQPVNVANIPHVIVDTAPTTTVTGTVTANQGGTWTVQPGNTANTTAWKVDGSAVTQPVSGTVTSNQGGTWTVQPGNTANTTAWKVDGSAVTQPVSGTFWQATQPVSGTVTANQGGAPWVENVTQFGGTNISTGTGTGGAGIPRVTVSNDSNVLATQSGTWTVQPGNTANTTAWKVDGSAVTQPVSGTVTANVGTTNGLALDATLTGGAMKTKIVDGSGNVIASTSNALNVQCANCSGSGASATDQASFTAGSSTFAPLGGFYNDSAAALANGTQGMARLTANRAQHINLRDNNGSELGVRTNPEFVADSVLAQILTAIQRQGTRLSGAFGRSITSTGDALDVNIKYQAATLDPCAGVSKQSVSVSQTANARLLVAPAGRVFVCSAFVVGADAENISLVEGTGATCGTGTAAVIGGATAATGPNFAANGGFTLGNGGGTVAITATPGNDVCLFQSGSGRVAGVLTVAVR